MSEREIRIGDAEREHALELLGAHLGQGRLTVDEFGERSARVATARTRGDLLVLFADLPAPRPEFSRVAPLPPADRPGRAALFSPKVSGVLLPAAIALSVVLFLVSRFNPYVFLIIPVVLVIAGRMGNR
ncbi:DUF1707 SHOCT-like domain-containing protein [Saccharothrix lopnurensis]|uniref:DUF1707 domain-containing protein n=1 Tax=Saccharothrix lopnurensis TaxID=1670621 RepID=A0ABW1P3B2_9PSEU